MKIAVIGGGISGLGAALALGECHDVTLFERASRFGGHANTVEIDYDDTPVAVDTGFIVYNRKTYPNLIAFFDHLGVPTQWSDMSFGYSLRGGALEWAGDNLGTVFAQRRNLLRPRFLRAMASVKRFNERAVAARAEGSAAGMSLGAWLDREGFGRAFREIYLLPMAGAIWSTTPHRMEDFPADSFFDFFENHDLLKALQPRVRWRTVTGGSREYVRRVVERLGDRAVPRAAIARVTREPAGVSVVMEDGGRALFDQVVFATPAEQALAMLPGAMPEERALLSAQRTTANEAVLHRDPALMPRRRKVWSSWNVMSAGRRADAERPMMLTYWMNRLQDIDRSKPLFVTLNPSREPDPSRTFARFAYAHPLYDMDAARARAAMDGIQGTGGVWYAGAWLGHGFHEDGLCSGLRVATALGARPGWAASTGPALATPAQLAAE